MLIKKFFPLRKAADDTDGEGGGASTVDDGEAVGSGNDARVAFLNAINDANDEARADELAHVNDDGTTEAYTPLLNADAEDQQQVDDAIEAQTSEANTDDADAALSEELFTIKVNGTDRQLTRAQLIERAQKVEAADTYLADAARIRREAQAATTPQKQAPSAEEAARAQDEDLRGRVRAIQMGSEEEAIAALKGLLPAPAPSLTRDDVVRAMDERLTFKDAYGRFEKDFADVLGDKVLRELAFNKDRQMLAQGDTRGYAERFTAIGTELRTWRDSLTPSATKPPAAADPLETKAQRKAAAPSAPKPAAAKSAAALSEDEGEESASDVIAKIAKARGAAPHWARA